MNGIITLNVHGIVEFSKHFHVLNLILSTLNPVRETNAKEHLRKDMTGHGV